MDSPDMVQTSRKSSKTIILWPSSKRPDSAAHLYRSHNVGDAKQLQQLLTLPVHLRGRALCAARCSGSLQQAYTIHITEKEDDVLYGCNISRVGQNPITVYIRYFWQGNHQMYGHIRCIYTVLANPKYKVLQSCPKSSPQQKAWLLLRVRPNPDNVYINASNK